MYNQNPHQSRMPPSGTPGSNFQMPGSQQSAENNPFSPPGSMQSLHPASQQSLGGPLSQQPPSHHSLQPMSNAPATPATPQQQLQQPASTGGVSQQAPHSVGPPSHSAMQQPQHDASAAQQHAAVAAAARKAAIEHTDPITATRHLIIHDVRHAITELNGAIANLITSNLPDPTQAEEEKKPPAAPASVTNPYSMNPQSVTNPQSVNPMSVNVPTAMSVNPMSVNPPGSVKSVDEPHQAQASSGTAPTPGSAVGIGAAATAADGNNPSDIFHSKYSNFLNICDQVERNLATITEAYRQCQKFESLQTHQFKTAGEAQNASYSKIVQPFVEYSLDDRRHIEQAIGEMTQLMNRVRAKTKRSNGTAQQPQGNGISADQMDTT